MVGIIGDPDQTRSDLIGRNRRDRPRSDVIGPGSGSEAPMRLEQRLANLGERLQKARRDLQISEEQLAFQTEVADDAQTRMLVAGTPLADREAREARDDLARLRRQRDDARAFVDDLVRERDRLLDRLAGKLSARGGN
jgi:hypothetical protein